VATRSLFSVSPAVTHPVLTAAAAVTCTLALIPLLASGKAWILLASLGVALAALYLVCRPHWAVLGILVFWFFDINLTGAKYVSVPYLLAALLMIPLTVTVLRDRGIWVLRVPQLKLFLGLSLVFLAALAWSYLTQPAAPIAAVDETWRQVRLFVTRLGFLIFVLYFVRTPRQVTQTLFLLVLMILVSAGDALHPFLKGAAMDRAHGSMGLAENSNRLAFVAVFAASVIWFFRAYAPPRWWKPLTAPLLLVLPVTVLMTASRNGLLQLVLLGALALKEQKHWSPSRRMYSFLFLVAVGLVALVVVPSANLLRATTFDPTVVRPGQESLRNRFTTVVAALDMAARNPVLGVGPGNFRWRHQAEWGNDRETHNSYLWALTAGGPLFLLLYLLIFHRTYLMLRAAEGASPPHLVWVAKTLRVNLILFMLFSAFADFWLSEFLHFIVGLTVALYNLTAGARAARPVPAPARPAAWPVATPSPAA